MQSSPKLRPPEGILDGAEASECEATESASAGAPSPPPPELAGAAVVGAHAKLGQTSLSKPAAEAWGARHAQAPEDRRRQAAAPSGHAPPASVGADGSAAPPDGGAPSDPKRGPHRGAQDGAEDRKPERAALETQAPGANPHALLSSAGRLSGRLAALAETAKDYARSAQADNTQRAYTADWKMFASWLRRQGLRETPPDPEAVGLHLAAQVERGGAELSVATLERRLSGIAWRYRQLGQPLDIRDRHIASVLAGIRRRHGRPPLQKAAIFADELLAMLATLDMDLRGLRDGRSWRSASPAASAAPKSSGSTAAPIRPRTALAGSKSSPRAPCSPSVARPAGARSRLVAARDRRPPSSAGKSAALTRRSLPL
jgi:hypothetical protein